MKVNTDKFNLLLNTKEDNYSRWKRNSKSENLFIDNELNFNEHFAINQVKSLIFLHVFRHKYWKEKSNQESIHKLTIQLLSIYLDAS